jgi:hypothetical protein
VSAQDSSQGFGDALGTPWLGPVSRSLHLRCCPETQCWALELGLGFLILGTPIGALLSLTAWKGLLPPCSLRTPTSGLGRKSRPVELGLASTFSFLEPVGQSEDKVPTPMGSGSEAA